jgi:phospholipid transport system substrate-binding protein
LKQLSHQTSTPGTLQPPGNDAPRWFLRTVAALSTVVTIMAGLAIVSPLKAQDSPVAATQELVNNAIKILANKQTPLVERRRELKSLMESRFDSAEMARSTLGYHWRSLSAQQRADFTHLFTAFIEAAYLDKVQDYSGQQVQFGQMRSLGQGYAEVDTTIVQPGKSPIPVNYLLQQTAGSWKIYDVTVDNISIIANYRNQFNRVINEQGFPKLMADLQAKQRQLGSELGQG